jgi:hypothetical protein
LQIEREEQKRQQHRPELIDCSMTQNRCDKRRISVPMSLPCRRSTQTRLRHFRRKKMAGWSEWALAQANRIDPVRSARFIDTFDEKDDAN